MNLPRVAGYALLAVGIAILGVAAWAALDDGSSGSVDEPTGSLGAAVADPTPASAPFEGLTETTVRVGDEELSVVIADDGAERFVGLRRRETIGPYDGMLFAYTEDTLTSFTMSTVPVPLEIGFYDASGRVVDRLQMVPCEGTDADCPSYQPSGPFRYALETLEGDLPRGRLR